MDIPNVIKDDKHRMRNNDITLPRIFIDHDIAAGKPLPLLHGQVHYLKNVLRKQRGDNIRVFNGRDGEWLCALDDFQKQGGSCVAQDKRLAQPDASPALHLFFAPIKKQRLDFLVEKAVELGVSDLHPVLTARTSVHKVNIQRMQAHIIEAAEQCERLDMPVLHAPIALRDIGRAAQQKSDIPLYVCLERYDVQAGADKRAEDSEAYQPIPSILEIDSSAACGFLIGPEGGFDPQERAWLLSKPQNITLVSLGERILRAETAALACLAAVLQKRCM